MKEDRMEDITGVEYIKNSSKGILESVKTGLSNAYSNVTGLAEKAFGSIKK